MASGQKKEYRNATQAAGISLPGMPKGVPMKATPVSKPNIGLGAKTIAHPFTKGKPTI